MYNMSEEMNYCFKLIYPFVKHKTIKLNYDLNNLDKWNTEVNKEEIFGSSKVKNKKIGKRRELLIKYFKISASKVVLEEILNEFALSKSSCLSEYYENFCNNGFTPLIDSKFDILKFVKNNLYNGNVQTYYKEQFDKGNFKSTFAFQNKNRPFVKSTLFTTPPELAFEEPVEGF